MKVLFHLGHPAHFHLFKNTINSLVTNKHEVLIVIKKKDILEDLLKNAGLDYINILPEGRKDGKFYVAIGQLKQSLALIKVAIKFQPNLLVGTSVAISHAGKLLGIPSLNVNEDDAEVVPLYAKLAYPWATHILSPKVCNVGKWDNKKLGYAGYHELAYLHPDNFTPNPTIASKYVNIDSKYFLIRFAKLNAHHDDGVRGISGQTAKNLVSILEKFGKVYITSERALEDELEHLRININPLDIHHVMNFCSLYIGDSQTMAAEAGVLGVPFIRYNDFVGRIGYLKELEDIYNLGFGILPNNEEALESKVKEILEMPNSKDEFQRRRTKMLSEKVNLSTLLYKLIENYPSSIKQLKDEGIIK